MKHRDIYLDKNKNNILDKLIKIKEDLLNTRKECKY
jgi:hypothetical protein